MLCVSCVQAASRSLRQQMNRSVQRRLNCRALQSPPEKVQRRIAVGRTEGFAHLMFSLLEVVCCGTDIGVSLW